jgi:DNA-binding transcriptional regulator YiaG
MFVKLRKALKNPFHYAKTSDTFAQMGDAQNNQQITQMDGRELQFWRQSRGFRTAHIAEALNVSRRTLEKWEWSGRIPEKNISAVNHLVRKEAILLRIPATLFQRLESAAQKAGFTSTQAFAVEILC